MNIFDNVLNAAMPDMGKAEFASGVDKLTNYISDMIDYNRIIQVYLNMSNTPQTRIEIFSKVDPLKKNCLRNYWISLKILLKNRGCG